MLLVLAASTRALAYGPEGHLIAGRAAESLLCPRAAAQIAILGGGEDLGEIGLWADRIRDVPRYADSGPWHYMNIDDDESLADYRSPPEGDILAALVRFGNRLRDPTLDDAQRAEALRFLVHFVVDLHQPLHVGRAADRGGNEIALEFDGEATNLHRLWDSDAIAWRRLDLRAYTDEVAASVSAIEGAGVLDARIWAAESRALRDRVYDFGATGRQPDDAYLDRAALLTRLRLTQAAARLAGTLNSLLCG